MAELDARPALGLALPQRSRSWEVVADWAAAAEAAGFSSLWLPGESGLDPLSALAALTRTTGEVRLGAYELRASLRPPALLGKALSTIDISSGGRVELGLRASPGTEAEAHELSEVLQVLAGAFGGGPFSFDGRFHRVSGLRCLPRPLQRPGPPVSVVGLGDQAFEVAARYADGWGPGTWTATPEEYRDWSRRLDGACEEVGRDPSTVEHLGSCHILVGEDEADLQRHWELLLRRTPPRALPTPSLDEYRKDRLVGTAGEIRDRLGRWAECGVTTLILGIGALPFADDNADDLVLDDLVLDDLELVVSAVV